MLFYLLLKVSKTKPKLIFLKQIWIHVSIGEYKCGSFLPCDDAGVSEGPPKTCTKADAPEGSARIDCQNDGSTPPVEIIVDFGDGSGEQKWERENIQDVWTHSYSQPGIYTIFVMSM